MAQRSTTWGYSKETCQDKRVFAEEEMHPAIGNLAQCGRCKEWLWIGNYLTSQLPDNQHMWNVRYLNRMVGATLSVPGWHGPQNVLGTLAHTIQ